MGSGRVRPRATTRARMSAIGLVSRLLFPMQQESLKGEIAGDEKPNCTDPDRHGPLSDRYAPTVDEPQRVEEARSKRRSSSSPEGTFPASLQLPHRQEARLSAVVRLHGVGSPCRRIRAADLR